MDEPLDPADPGDTTLVAFTPAEMVPAQQNLSAWCDRKIAAIETELADLQANLELATAHGWKHASVAATLARTARRVTYYQKLKAAVDAGYLLVPNFPIDLFAVRVQRSKQPEKVTDTRWSSNFNADAQLLPAGDGRYVDERVFHSDESRLRTIDGKEQLVRRYVSGDYDEVDFPVTLAKPIVLEATARAMALKIFDQMGLVQNQSGRDPIVVGRILDPRKNRRCATFFVAWWLDTATL